MKNRGYLQISFGWMFAIIVGMVILFLAIFAVVKIIGTEQKAQDAKMGKEMGILLNPLETGFESVRATSLIFPVETRIYNKCDNSGYFGRQVIQISQKSFGKWTKTNIDIGFSNKYIFSDSPAEGKKFYVFAKPFEFPFKVADLIYITSSSKEYCFVNPPRDIEDEISSINQENLLIEDCSDSAIRVCFKGNCEINVEYEQKVVEKDGERVYFEGDTLMYAAIFSEPELYECQLKRIMQRTKNLALLYKDKATFVSRAGCYSNLNTDLLVLVNLVNSLESSANLGSIGILAEDIQDKNELNSECGLW